MATKAIIMSACPSGLATSFLAANRLKNAALRRGWEVRVELEGKLGNGERLTADEIAAADLVLVAASRDVDLSRFAGKKLYRDELEAALPNPDRFLDRAELSAKPWEVIEGATPAIGKSTASTATPVPKDIAQARVVAITACPTGVAHTFMAAEALQEAGKKMGLSIHVETQGSVGAQNKLETDEIAAADVVLLACDIDVDTSRFAGKRIYRCPTNAALKKPRDTIETALAEGDVEDAEGAIAGGASKVGKKSGSVKDRGVYKHLLTGVSFMLPMVVAGGLCIALSFMFGINAFKQPGTLAAALMDIGGNTAFKLMVPVLSGYIAYSISDRPGIAPGMIGGMLATTLGAGFIGGIISGFIAGYGALAVVKWLPLPKSLEALKPILIVPLLSSLVTGLIMIYIVGTPVSAVLNGLTHYLNSMGSTNALLLGLLLGGMVCVDMGGPVNKAAYAFGVGLLSTQTYGPMAAIMGAGMVPPLAMGLATLLAKRKFQKTEREAGKAALALGLCFVTEGAIPFAAKDPLRVLPTCIIGGAITGGLSMSLGVTLMAPHGGMFVLLIPGAVQHVLAYLISILAGTILTGVLYALIKPRLAEEDQEEEVDAAVLSASH